MQLLNSQKNYDNYVYESYYDFIRRKNFKDRSYNYITTIRINSSTLPDIINVCNCFNLLEMKVKSLFIISDIKNYDLFDKYEYKIDYITLKRFIDLGITNCKYIKDINTTRFKKSQLIKYPKTKDIIEYNYSDKVTKYYITDKYFIIIINIKRGK